MFSFRRKPKKNDAQDAGPPYIRTSPSLPELSAQGIRWPEDLVDVGALPDDKNSMSYSPVPETPPPIPGSRMPVNSFETTKTVAPPPGGISALYMASHPPSAFENRRTSYTRSRPSQKRARNPTTFNIMVVGAQGTGKTSLLRLLLDTADISPTATAEQRANMEAFLRGSPKRTEAIQTACVEICESKYDRLMLTVIDTPGLDFQNGHELNLERQVTSIVKYMDAQFADTLSEESKVVRQSKGDQHIHLCIYTIDPFSIMTASARKALSLFPSRTRSETTISHSNGGPNARFENRNGDSEDEDEEEDNVEWTNLTMSPADIHVIRRLTTRANVLPVVARADSLTDGKLTAIKKVLRRDLDAVGLDFGVFGPAAETETQPILKSPTPVKPHANGHNRTDSKSGEGSDDISDPSEDERPSRPIIKLRSRHSAPRRPSHSRSRRELSEAANEPTASEVVDTESIASVRFSAQIVTKGDMTSLLPFALIAPEHVRRRKSGKKARPTSALSTGTHHSVATVHTATTSRRESIPPMPATPLDAPASPSSSHDATNGNGHLAFPSVGPPADLKGVFVRRFRWGTVDVLNPEHCDFAALRTAILSTHMKMLKVRTKEVLYEKFRTEKLLARRATANITEGDTRRLLQESLGTTDFGI